jgi:peptidoglycan/LPS O-acetylase OafA/YrhL
VISGFVIPWAMFHAKFELKDFFKFFLKRISRLEPPYMFSVFLALLVLYLRENYLGRSNEHVNVSLKQVALHVGYLIPFFEEYQWLNQVYWTLAIEFQYYLLIALLFIPMTRSSFWIRILLYCLILILSLYGDSRFLFYWLPLFLLGILLFMIKTRIISKSEYYITSIVILAYSIYLYPFWAVVYAFIPIVMVLFYPNLKMGMLHYLGNFSYSIYLIHPLIGASLINVLSRYCNSIWMKLGLVILGITITLIGAWFTYLFIEKPSKKLSGSIKYSKK